MRRFHESIHTTAVGQAIWDRWIDVEHWSVWDTSIEYAKLNGPFQEGQLGVIKRIGMPEAEFFLSNIREGKSLTINTVLPFKTRIEDWFIIMEGKQTREVIHGQRYEGFLSWFYAIKLANTMREHIVESLERTKKELEGKDHAASTSNIRNSNTPDLDMKKDVNINY